MPLQPLQKKPFEAVLFDLDGTLLRVQMTDFIPRYISGLAEHCREYAKPKAFVRGMQGAICGLIRDAGDGRTTNERRVYSFLQQQLSIPEQALKNSFQQFADNQLDSLQDLVKPIPLARKILAECQQRGLKLVLATNPVFPEFMIQARLRWGGLADIPFDYVTSFENSHHCKPHPGYFRDIADRLQLDPKHCLMVGNDTSHDLAAIAVGMTTFLVDTWIVERDEARWHCEHRGDHDALHRFIERQFY